MLFSCKSFSDATRCKAVWVGSSHSTYIPGQVAGPLAGLTVPVCAGQLCCCVFGMSSAPVFRQLLFLANEFSLNGMTVMWLLPIFLLLLVLWVSSNDPLPNPRSQRFMPMFCNGFIVFIFTFRSLIHFELILVYRVR